MDIKIKLSEGATMPKYSSEGAAGMDLTAISEKFRQERVGPVWEYDTGVAVEIPKGHVGLVFPRSSITTKSSLSLGNAVGVIDEDYRGTIKFQFRNTNQFMTEKYKVGDKIGQLIVLPYPKVSFTQVNELSSTQRDSGGFGSTGE